VDNLKSAMGNLKSAVYANHYNKMRHWNNALKRNVIKVVPINSMQLLKVESIVNAKHSTYCSLNICYSMPMNLKFLLGHYALLQKVVKNPRLWQSSHS
jgi:hypothetical protein